VINQMSQIQIRYRANVKILIVFVLGWLVPQSVLCEPWVYVERPAGPRFYLGDEDSRYGRAQYLAGNFGNAEFHFRRAVEVNPRNSAAWLGLASSYDRLGRFDLSERSYKEVRRLIGETAVFLNNYGYSCLLRGKVKEASRLLDRARRLDPGNPTIENNINVMNAGQDYYWGGDPYIWGWPH
jgi:tetratricopeptide (TPR) repeat protein